MMKTLGRGLSPLCISAPAASDPSLKASVPSTVFDLDATIAASYPGSGQSWFNLVAAPADGSAQGAYDFTLGASGSASSDDPAFTGDAGSFSACFLLDGGDFFRLSANTDFLNALHKTSGGTPFWLACAFRYADDGSLQEIFSTRSSSTPGMNIRIGSGDTPGLQQRGDSASVSISAAATIANGTDCAVIVSYDSGSVRFWTNSATMESASITPNATTADANNPARFGSGGSGGSFMPAGSRIYAAAMGNAFIGDAEAAQIFAVYEARHGRIYTT